MAASPVVSGLLVECVQASAPVVVFYFILRLFLWFFCFCGEGRDCSADMLIDMVLPIGHMNVPHVLLAGSMGQHGCASCGVYLIIISYASHQNVDVE